MCDAKMESVKKKGKANRHSIRKERILGVGMCKVCQERWKSNLYSAWNRWINGTPVRDEVILEAVKS